MRRHVRVGDLVELLSCLDERVEPGRYALAPAGGVDAVEVVREPEDGVGVAGAPLHPLQPRALFIRKVRLEHNQSLLQPGMSVTEGDCPLRGAGGVRA